MSDDEGDGKKATAAVGEDDEADDAADGSDVGAEDVINNNTYASNYVYDREKFLWCELTFNVSEAIDSFLSPQFIY